MPQLEGQVAAEGTALVGRWENLNAEEEDSLARGGVHE